MRKFFISTKKLKKLIKKRCKKLLLIKSLRRPKVINFLLRRGKKVFVLSFILIFFAILISAGVFYFSFKDSKEAVRAGMGENVGGYAWSENMGWFSFNSKDCDIDDNGFVDANWGIDYYMTDQTAIYPTRADAWETAIAPLLDGNMLLVHRSRLWPDAAAKIYDSLGNLVKDPGLFTSHVNPRNRSAATFNDGRVLIAYATWIFDDPHSEHGYFTIYDPVENTFNHYDNPIEFAHRPIGLDRFNLLETTKINDNVLIAYTSTSTRLGYFVIFDSDGIEIVSEQLFSGIQNSTLEDSMGLTTIDEADYDKVFMAYKDDAGYAWYRIYDSDPGASPQLSPPTRVPSQVDNNEPIYYISAATFTNGNILFSFTRVWFSYDYSVYSIYYPSTDTFSARKDTDTTNATSRQIGVTMPNGKAMIMTGHDDIRLYFSVIDESTEDIIQEIFLQNYFDRHGEMALASHANGDVFLFFNDAIPARWKPSYLVLKSPGCDGDNTTDRAFEYGVNIDSSGNLLLDSGGPSYAWSPNVGWIRFGGSDVPPDSYAFNVNCPGTCDATNNCTACYDSNNDNVYGWAKILKLGEYGWLKLNGDDIPDWAGQGVSIDPGTSEFSGWAWNTGGICVGGDNNGFGCAQDTDCPSGVCQYGICEGGGADDGDSCEQDSECLGGICKYKVGVGWVSFNSNNCDVNDDGLYAGPGELAPFDCPWTGTVDDYEVYSTEPPPASPDAINLTAPNWNSDEACNSGAKKAFLRWDFSDPNLGDNQDAYQLGVWDTIKLEWTVDTGEVTGIPGTANQVMVSSALLSYDTPYTWYVQVWDDSILPKGANPPNGLASPLRSYGADEDTDNDDGVQATFTTYKHEFPKVYFSHTPDSPKVGEEVTFINSDSPNGLSKFYFTGPGTAINCNDDFCDYFWTVSPDDGTTISDPTASTTVITFISENSYNVTLRVTDNEGYSCTKITPMSATIDLPTWKEVKSD